MDLGKGHAGHGRMNVPMNWLGAVSTRCASLADATDYVGLSYYCSGHALSRSKSNSQSPLLAAKVAELSEAARTTALVAYAFLYTEQAPTRFEALRRAARKSDETTWSFH